MDGVSVHKTYMDFLPFLAVAHSFFFVMQDHKRPSTCLDFSRHFEKESGLWVSQDFERDATDQSEGV